MQIPLKHWQAWTPGASTIDEWQKFLMENKPVTSSLKPDVSFLPPMFRRKLSPLTRMVFSTAHSLEQQNGPIDAPVVLATRHGELDLSIDLINAELSDSPLSPAKFSMSVHNSPVGFLSIQSRNTNPNTAISAGARTLEMGLLESIAMLKEYRQCLLIYADESLSKVYDQYKDEQSFPICLAILLDKNAAETEVIFSNKKLQALQFIKHFCGSIPNEAP